MMVDLDAVMRAVSAALEASGSRVLNRAGTRSSSATGLARVGEKILTALLEQARDRPALEHAVTDRIEHRTDPDSLGSLRWQVKKVLMPDALLALTVRKWLIESDPTRDRDTPQARPAPSSPPSRKPVSYGYDRSERPDPRRCPSCGRTGPLSSRDSSTRTCSNGHTWDV